MCTRFYTSLRYVRSAELISRYSTALTKQLYIWQEYAYTRARAKRYARLVQRSLFEKKWGDSGRPSRPASDGLGLVNIPIRFLAEKHQRVHRQWTKWLGHLSTGVCNKLANLVLTSLSVSLPLQTDRAHILCIYIIMVDMARCLC